MCPPDPGVSWERQLPRWVARAGLLQGARSLDGAGTGDLAPSCPQSCLALPSAVCAPPRAPSPPATRRTWQHLFFTETPKFENVSVAVTGWGGLSQGSDSEAIGRTRWVPVAGEGRWGCWGMTPSVPSGPSRAAASTSPRGPGPEPTVRGAAQCEETPASGTTPDPVPAQEGGAPRKSRPLQPAPPPPMPGPPPACLLPWVKGG